MASSCVNAQGEDVVAGIRTPQSLTETGPLRQALAGPSLEALMPETFAELNGIFDRLERHYRDMQDVEFTIQEGKLWMLQTRSGKRTAQAALKIAVDLAQRRHGLARGGDERASMPHPSISSFTRPSIRKQAATSSAPAFPPRRVRPQARSSSIPMRPRS